MPGGLKSAWVIAKVIDRLARLYAPLSTENYLSFIQWLQSSAPSRVSHTVFYHNVAVCICNCTYVGMGRGVSVGFWRPLNGSFHKDEEVLFLACFPEDQ